MTITLMDTCVWGLTVVGMIYVVLRPPASRREMWLSTVPFALAPVARPEGMAVAPLLIALLWLRVQPERQRRVCAVMGMSVGMTIAALTVFRLAYFGHPLPNTYYAKVAPSLAYNLQQGWLYLHGFALSGTIVGVAIGVTALITAVWIARTLGGLRKKRPLRSLLRSRVQPHAATAIAACALLALPVLTGGDHFRLFRFFQPAYPLLCVTVVL
jgi:hypothetical protein